MPHLKQGLLISIEGIDGSGKSTLAQNLARIFDKKDYAVVLTREPGGTPLGQAIRTIVQQKTEPRCAKAEFLLFAADRAQHFDQIIIPALAGHKLVISDRMIDSSLAYQGYGNNLDLEQIRTISHWAMNTIVPHLTIFVQIPINIALERIAKRNATLSHFEKEAFLKKVAHGFEELYKNRTDVMIVDGMQSPENLATTTNLKIEQWIHSNNLLTQQ